MPLLEQILKLRQAKLGPDHPDTLYTASSLGTGYRAAGKLDRALPLLEQAVAGIERKHFESFYAGQVVQNLTVAYEQQKRFGEAETWRRKWLEVVTERSGPKSMAYAGDLTALARDLLGQQKWTEAQNALRDSLAIRVQQAPDDWATFESHSMLGAALLGRKKFSDAAEPLQKGYDGMKERSAKIPEPVRAVRLAEAVERLVQLDDALAKKDEAAKWRRELEALQKAEKSASPN